MESEGVIAFSLSIFAAMKFLNKVSYKILSVSVGKMHAHGI